MTADRCEDYRRTFDWSAGESTVKRISLGSISGVAQDRVLGLGLLRVGYAGARIGDAVSVVLQGADGGTQWGTDAVPLDVPLAIAIEQPVTVVATPVASHPNPISLRLALSPICAPSDRLYATRTVILNMNDTIELPQWVRGVAALPSASFQFRDRAGVPLNSPGMVGAHDRPAMALDIIANAAGTFILYY